MGAHKQHPGLTVYPPAVWRRITETLDTDVLRQSSDLTDSLERVAADTWTDLTVRRDLEALALTLTRMLADRWARLEALHPLYPTSSTVGEALECAGFSPEDVAIPDWACNNNGLPADLTDARTLLAWLEAHPSKLPPVPSDGA